jgi:hypothetical protein
MFEGLAFHGDLGYTQVDVRRQPAVELDFSPTVLGSGRWRGKVGEVEAKRLAELEDTISEK